MRLERIEPFESMVAVMSLRQNCSVTIRLVANAPLQMEMTDAMGHNRMVSKGGALENEFQIMSKIDSWIDEKFILDPGSYYFIASNDHASTCTIAVDIIFEYEIPSVKIVGWFQRLKNKFTIRKERSNDA